ncbi:hypothetical protein FO519_008309 [Halicephalobus sp. NKZ332]|nr:hypothetical protein FO519_008309 [Halicephalobus sp. NKZ332]
MVQQSATNATACLDMCFNKWEFGGETLVDCDLEPNGTDTCAGSTIVSHDDKAIILSFRGSVGSHQVTEENGSLGDKVPFPGGGMVSHYFYNAFLQASHISQVGMANPSNMKLVNFGGPHGGDLAWAQRIPTLVPWAYRVVHHWDYVPHIPTNPNWTYTHHKIEIWYNNSMTEGDPFVTCVELESKDCSDSVDPSDYTWDDHGTYFQGKGCELCQKAPLE